MRRVLLISPSSRLLGARRSLVDLATQLPSGWEPLVAAPGGTGGDLGKALAQAGVSVADIPQHAWRKLGGRIGALWSQIPKLRRLITSFKPDILHANEFHACPQALAAAARKIPVVGHVRLSITPRQIETYGMENCAAVVCVSEAVRTLFAGTQIQGQVHVIYNGVNLDSFTPGAAPLPETAAWPADALVVGLLGLVSERKNQLVALDAVARAASMGADVRLVLAGDPFKSSEAYGNQVRARMAQPDLAGRVVWLPFRQEVVPIYRALHLNLLVSSEEGFGRTIIEAGAMGIPSIGSRIGGIPELIEEGRTGWLVPDRDPEALASALAEAARDRRELASRGDAARARVRDHFTSEATVRRLTALWERTIAETP